MFCMRCGNELPDNAAFCNKCGAQMGQMRQMNQMPRMQQMPQMQQMPPMGAMQQPYPYAPYQKKNNSALAVVTIISAVLSIPLLILGFMRYNVRGYTWSPPFSSYELITLIMLTVGGLALLLAIIFGIIILVRKSG